MDLSCLTKGAVRHIRTLQATAFENFWGNEWISTATCAGTEGDMAAIIACLMEEYECLHIVMNSILMAVVLNALLDRVQRCESLRAGPVSPCWHRPCRVRVSVDGGVKVLRHPLQRPMDAPGLGFAGAEHGSLLLGQLEKMRAAEELTDVVLLAEGIPFPCHKVVLSAFSPFLQNQPDEEPDKLSDCVFQFDRGEDRWTACASMTPSRYCCGTATLKGEIYILGGIGCGPRTVTPLPELNPHTDTWREGPTQPASLLTPRTKASNTAVVEGHHEIISKEILELDPADNVWTVVERRAAMHDSHDVCLVAKLNPRGLLTP